MDSENLHDEIKPHYIIKDIESLDPKEKHQEIVTSTKKLIQYIEGNITNLNSESEELSKDIDNKFETTDVNKINKHYQKIMKDGWFLKEHVELIKRKEKILDKIIVQQALENKALRTFLMKYDKAYDASKSMQAEVHVLDRLSTYFERFENMNTSSTNKLINSFEKTIENMNKSYNFNREVSDKLISKCIKLLEKNGEKIDLLPPIEKPVLPIIENKPVVEEIVEEVNGIKLPPLPGHED